MIRAPLGDQKYWDHWETYRRTNLAEEWDLIRQPSKNPMYRPQYVFDTAKEHLRYELTRYCRGDPIGELGQHFAGLLDAWELSNKLAAELTAQLKPGEGWDHRHLLIAPLVSSDPRSHNDPRSWVFALSNLEHYNYCFWLVGLALTLELPDDQWRRLLALIGGEGQDAVLDRVIATRQPQRKIGTKVLHKKPYARLLAAIDAPKEQQPQLLRDFVEHWYAELERKGEQRLWWYNFGDPVKHPLKGGSYFGRWCIEAAAAAKVFDIDDSLCLGHEHYPGDLLRPNGPSTHAQRAEPKTGLLARLFGKKTP
jgi:Domain of unknown function (DUF1911)/Domain of unknown function (DUF1910)